MRLTEKYDVITAVDKSGIEYHSKGIHIKDKKLAEEKLFQLEDIEDELGIDLITLFKALYEGVWVKTKNGISFHNTIHLHKWQQVSLRLFYRPYSHLRIKDYGKTWALTKEELL